jgi:hypothetical protein
MVRMGQSSVRAALIYQHSSLEHQREIADNIDARVRGERAKGTAQGGQNSSGTQRAREA